MSDRRLETTRIQLFPDIDWLRDALKRREEGESVHLDVLVNHEGPIEYATQGFSGAVSVGPDLQP